MAMSRQVQLRCGTTTVDLEVDPFKLVAGSWASAGRNLECQVVVQATTLATLDRYVATLQRLAARAGAYDKMLVGDPVEVWTKTCDDLAAVAELGATWLKKRVKSLTVLAPDASTSASGHFAVTVALSLEVDEVWRRAAPECVLEGATVTATIYGTTGIRTTSGNAITGRRIGNYEQYGVAARFHYIYFDVTCDFFAIAGTTLKGSYNQADNKFYIYDNTPVTPQSASTAAVAWTEGTIHDIIFGWDLVNGEMYIVLDGVKAATAAVFPAITNGDTYSLVDPSGASAADLLSAQIWATVITSTQAVGLYAWGQPEAELCGAVPPADTANGNAVYKLYNAPGDAPSPLRVVLDGAAQDYALVRLGLRPLRIPTTVKWECESGTLGTDTASVADASASGGNVARFTPAATTWVTRVTLALAADPDDVAALVGEHRLLLACRDAAASVNINRVRWRVVVAGQAEGWSDTKGVAVVGAYSLLDLGVLQLPPGQWPAESVAAVTDVTGGTYVTLELQVANTAGNGGGTFDLDALFLAPAEAEGTLTLTFDVSAYYGLLDFTGERAAFIGVADPRSLEFAAWGDYVGDSLELTPIAGSAGALTLAWLRDAVETWYAGDLCDVWLFIEPRYRR